MASGMQLSMTSGRPVLTDCAPCIGLDGSWWSRRFLCWTYLLRLARNRPHETHLGERLQCQLRAKGLNTDVCAPLQGFDPFMVYGFLSAGCLGTSSSFYYPRIIALSSSIGLGALLGPTVGGALWRFTHRHQAHLIDEKDRAFLQHIAKNRVDASLQSATSPVPDYYGTPSVLPSQ